jgi:hypothetical protein
VPDQRDDQSDQPRRGQQPVQERETERRQLPTAEAHERHHQTSERRYRKKHYRRCH